MGKWRYFFRTCEGNWVEYRGWQWGNLPPEDRKRRRKRRRHSPSGKET